MRNFNILILCCAALFLITCENVNDPGELLYKNSLLFNLKVNETEQKIYIYNTLPPKVAIKDIFSMGNYSKYFAKNAEIKIINKNNIYNNFYLCEFLKYETILKYYSNSETMEFSPNTTYKIEIASNGQIITGETTTPGNFDILNLKERNTVNINENKKVSISWSESENSKFYKVNIYPAYQEIWYVDKDTVVLNYEFDFIRVTEDVFNNNKNFSFWFNTIYDSVKVEVLAYDENYYNHIINKDESSGIENAYGYFGSAIKKEVIFINNK